MNFLSDLETDLNPTPQFLHEQPDQRKDWPELNRQATFLRLIRMAAPRLLVFANANAGKRNPRQAKSEGIRGGVFDLTVLWTQQRCAYIEFKGYTKAGRPGKLSDNQIRFGNRLVELGIPCASFFSPFNAVNWLREQGFPIAQIQTGREGASNTNPALNTKPNGVADA